jgi:hypothetical protein
MRFCGSSPSSSSSCIVSPSFRTFANGVAAWHVQQQLEANLSDRGNVSRR